MRLCRMNCDHTTVTAPAFAAVVAVSVAAQPLGPIVVHGWIGNSNYAGFVLLV